MKSLKTKLNRLPELPIELFEMGGKLVYSDTAPVLTVKPHKYAKPDPPAIPIPIIPKSQAYKRKYLSQCFYPLVVCYPFVDTDAVAALKINQHNEYRVRDNETDLEVIAKQERFYKLTLLNGVKLSTTYGCTVKYGPWSAIVVEKESCNVGEPNHWQFNAVSPDINLEWYGTWEDIPSLPMLEVITGDLYLVNETYECCPGYKWCRTTNSCIPFEVECQDLTPV